MARPRHLNSTVYRTLSLTLLFSMPLLLSGQEVSKEDLPKCESLKVFVHYDYMGYAGGQAACSTDDQCTSLGSGHAGERWVYWTGDLRMAIEEVLAGRLSLRDYLRSLRGPLESAIFSWEDPLPGVLDLPLFAYEAGKRALQAKKN